MEYLRIVKQPIKRHSQIESINNNTLITSSSELNNENSNTIDMFIHELENRNIIKQSDFNKRLRVHTSKMFQIQKLNRRIVLEQATSDEIQNIHDKFIETQKGKIEEKKEDEIAMPKNSTVKKDPRHSHIKKGEVIETAMNHGIASDLYEEYQELLSKYKSYEDSTSFLKVQLNQTYINNNKIAFLNDMKRKLMNYQDFDSNDSCDSDANDKGFEPLIHQQIVMQYLNSYSPYRGLLLFHGLGSGKTCSSIGIIEAMKYTKKKIYIMTPASLQKNYKTQMKFCGNELFRENHYWEYIEFPKDQSRKAFLHQVHDITDLPLTYLNKKNGIYMAKKGETKTNFHELSHVEKQNIIEQIDTMIDNRYQFINYNGITQNKWSSYYTKNGKENPFHHSTVIIDEGHNFVSRVINKLNVKKDTVSTQIYQSLMSADNCNVVVLSGTPLINYPCELGVLFNIIGGYNYALEIRLGHKIQSNVSMTHFKKILNEKYHDLIDMIDYSPNTNTLTVTKNPYGFVKDKKSSNLVYNFEHGQKTIQELYDELYEYFKQLQYTIYDFNIVAYKKFPDTEDEFNKYFVGKSNNLIRKEYFQRKIIGMVSYLGDKKSLMPDMIVPETNTTTLNSEREDKMSESEFNEDIFVQKLIMNDYVLKEYAKLRKFESNMDKKSKKKQSTGDKFNSSYRIFSRAACNFVFPETIKRPLPNSSLDSINEDNFDIVTDSELLTDSDGKYDESDLKEIAMWHIRIRS